MGCSPSKGKLFSKTESLGPQANLLVEPSQESDHSTPVEEVNTCLTTEEDKELPQPTDEPATKDTACFHLASDTIFQTSIEEIKVTGEDVTCEEIVDEALQRDIVTKIEKRKKTKCRITSSEKQRRSSILRKKVDFPPHMVRAHQAAYAFLNPSISKYETLLGLLDQAAQTQSSLQPTMSALVLHFEEINQALEEMAEEGESMLKEHGDCMTLPSGMMGPDVMPAKPRTDTENFPDPDLFQQLLQHSTEKMRLIGGSFQALGDTTLEEAVEYFSSFSNMLVQKLEAKQETELRLYHVLTRVEGAVMRKFNPEDSALHSEDSGIGGENESLTGSERHRRHHGSAGSCGSGVNIRSAIDSPSNKFDLIGENEDDEEDGENNDNEEEYEEGDRTGRKRSNSSPPDPCQTLLYMHSNYTKYEQPTVKRPLTARPAVTKPKYSPSTRCVNIMIALQDSQRKLDQQMKKMAENHGDKGLVGPQTDLYRAGLRRNSLGGSAGGQKGHLRTYQSLCGLPMLVSPIPKQRSVRRLINTFSQGVDGRPGQSLANIPPHIRRPKKRGILLLSDTVQGNGGHFIINGNNNNNSWPDSRDDLDLENLPPPPPEVLLDNSFQSTTGLSDNVEGLQGMSVQSLTKKSGVSHRLKASVQNVEVLPNRGRLKPKSFSILAAHPLKQDVVMEAQDAGHQPEIDFDPEREKANCFYQQAPNVHNTANSHDNQNIAELKGPSPLQARVDQRCESKHFCEDELSSYNLHVTAPPVSRVRLPPSCPSVYHRYPSPPVYRPQSTSGASFRPGSPRAVTHATHNNTEENSPSMSFRDARSVFCQDESQHSQTCSSLGSSMPPRAWGEVSRGRVSIRGMDNSTRRTQSERRPSLT